MRAAAVANTGTPILHAHIREHVAAGAAIYSDLHPGYNGLELDYAHQTVDHAVQYVDGRVHTNTMENFWSLLKRGLHGTYISVEPFHLFRYLDERLFTFNERALSDLQRFHKVLSAVAGRRLTYAELTAKS